MGEFHDIPIGFEGRHFFGLEILLDEREGMVVEGGERHELLGFQIFEQMFDAAAVVEAIHFSWIGLVGGGSFNFLASATDTNESCRRR